MEDPVRKSERIEEIRNKMKEKRRKKARDEMNGSWNKSFGKRRHCPNVSKILKASLKSNNRALAKSLQALKEENRMYQDMIVMLQHEQQAQLQRLYQMKQNEKENLRLRKELQKALNEVTSSLLNAGSKLGNAMELTTSFPVRDRMRSSVLTSSDDDSFGHRTSSMGPSVYYRKSERLVTPPIAETSQEPTPPPLPSDVLGGNSDDPGCSTDDDNQSQDPALECIDPSIMKELELDIPLMFTDDNLSEPDKEKEDISPIKQRTRTSRTSGLIDATCAAAAINSKGPSSAVAVKRKRPSSNRAPTDANPPAANTRTRVTFVVAQDIKENPESNDCTQITSPQLSHLASNILNETFEINDKEVATSSGNVESSGRVEKEDESSSNGEEGTQQVGEKTTYGVIDMELTEVENKESSVVSSKKELQVATAGKDIPGDLPESDCPIDVEVPSSGKADAKVSKKKSKLPKKAAKTKVSLKKKNFQETFQSPKSPLMSPGASGTGLSFRCVPSPVFGKVAKREHKLSKPRRKGKAELSVTSVFDLSEGDTFTEAKSFVLPDHESLLAQCDVKSPTKKASKERKTCSEQAILEDKSQESVEDNNREETSGTVKTNEKKKTSRTKDKRKNAPSLCSGKQQTEDKTSTSRQTVSSDARDTQGNNIQRKQVSNTTGRSKRDDDNITDAEFIKELLSIQQMETKKDAELIDEVNEVEVKETKINRKSRKSKSVIAPGGRSTNPKVLPEDASEIKTSKEGRKKSAYFPFDEQKEDASMFFITKPMIHRASKKKKGETGTVSGSQGTSSNGKVEADVVSSAQKDNQQDCSETCTQSSVTNVSPDEVKEDITADLLQDIDMVIEQRDQTEDATKNDQEDQVTTKIKKPRKKSLLSVMKGSAISVVPAMEQRTKSKSLNKVSKSKKNAKVQDEKDDVQDAEIDHMGVSEEVSQSRTSSRRSSSIIHQTKKGRKQVLMTDSEDEQDDMQDAEDNRIRVSEEVSQRRTSSRRSSGIPVTRKGRKRGMMIESEDEDGEDEDVAPAKQTKRSSVTKGNTRIKKSSKQSGREDQEEETDEKDKGTGRQRRSKSLAQKQIKMIEVDMEGEGENADALAEDNDDKQHGDLQTVEEEEKIPYMAEEVPQTAGNGVLSLAKGRKSKKKKVSATTKSKERQPVIAEDSNKEDMTSDKGDMLIAGKSTKKSKPVKDGDVQNGTAVTQSSDTTDALEENHLTNCLKKKTSSSKNNTQQKVSFQDTNLPTEIEAGIGQQSNPEVKGEGRRSSRRAAGSVSYREPTLNTKLRRGDPHTSNEFLTSSDIFKKKKPADKRKPLGNVMNTIEKPQKESLPETHAVE